MYRWFGGKSFTWENWAQFKKNTAIMKWRTLRPIAILLKVRGFFCFLFFGVWILVLFVLCVVWWAGTCTCLYTSLFLFFPPSAPSNHFSTQFLCVCLFCPSFKNPHISDSMQYMSVIMPSRFVHVVANSRASFPVSEYSIICMYHVWSIHSLTET